MKNVIITICFLILLSFFSENILPEGKMKAAVKSVFSCLAILCVLSPVKDFLEGDLSFGEINAGSVFDIDYYYTDKYFSSYKDRMEKTINSIIETAEIDGSATITYSVDDRYKFVVEKVTVKVKKSVINSENDNIHITDELRGQISRYLSISNEKVVIVYE